MTSFSRTRVIRTTESYVRFTGLVLQGTTNYQENKYYNAKSLKEDSPENAIKELESIVQLKGNHKEDDVEWIFKSFKQLIKINFHRQNYPEAIRHLKELVTFIPNTNKNYAEESISKILNTYSVCPNTAFVNELYSVILSYLKDSSGGGNDRLWLKININKLNSSLSAKQFDSCPELIDQINKKLDSVSETTRNSYALEVIAAEIEFYSLHEQLNLIQLNELYCKSLTVTSAVTHPRIMGIIRECGAKVQFYRENYEKARLEFYECFKNYDEAGSSAKKNILKYLSLCSVLTENEVNPFESQETKTYSHLPEYSNLILLIKSYDELNLRKFKEVLYKMELENDPLMKENIFQKASVQILRNLKSKIIINYFKSYSKITFDFITRKLDVTEDEFEDLVLNLSNLGKLSDVRVDFLNNYVEIGSEPSKPIIPATVSAQDVFYNVKSLEAIDFYGSIKNILAEESRSSDSMDIDQHSRNTEPIAASLVKPVSIMQRLLYVDRKPAEASEWFTVIESWLQSLSSAIPARDKDKLSQKDQIFSEQRAEIYEQTPTGDSEEQAAKNTNAGILGSTMADVADDELEDEGFEVNKLDVLRNWTKEVNKHHERLIKVNNP